MKIRKKQVLALFLGAVLAAESAGLAELIREYPGRAYADMYRQASVSATTLNVRSAPGTGNSIVGKLTSGETRAHTVVKKHLQSLRFAAIIIFESSFGVFQIELVHFLLHDGLEAHQSTSGHIIERLTAGHNIQIIVGHNAE